MCAAHHSTRPKGYMDWRPSPGVAEIVDNVGGILKEYGSYGPMTVRQIFYRLVGRYGYDKTERAYKRLAEYLVKARRSGMIEFHSIRDDGGTTAGGDYGHSTVDEFLGDLASYGESYRLSKSIGQPYHVELWCEAEGMVPMLGRMARPFGVPVTGTGGFSSLTVTHGFAARVAARERPTVLLHVGDFDPSGVSIFESMCQDIGAFVASKVHGYLDPETGAVAQPGYAPFFIPRRIALTELQVETHGLPAAPPKSSDTRSANWSGSTTQAEALPPDQLSAIVKSAIEKWWDANAYYELQARETAERELIGTRVSDAIEQIREDLS